MRNRIKGYWSWEDVGISPSELAPAAPQTRPPRTALQTRSAAVSERERTISALVVAGGVLAGLALIWGLGALVRRV